MCEIVVSERTEVEAGLTVGSSKKVNGRTLKHVN